MKIKLLKLWDSLHTSYWFVPTLMAIIATALAIAMLTLDRVDLSGPIEQLGWVYTGGPEGARTVLSSIAGSMITVAGTVFSITLVALQLASSQFGPRLLRNFMQDTGNQVVLGTFIATFIYCLLVLRTIRGEDYDVFVPQISVTVGIVLAIVSIGVLIYFIHHASTSIQASHVISEVGNELDKAIERLFPEKIGQDTKHIGRQIDEIPTSFDREACAIVAVCSGYLQAIDDNKLMEIAQQKDLLLRLNYRPGKFIFRGTKLVMVWPGKLVNEKLAKEINSAFILGRQRTEQQDVEFLVNQLVEIAVRAISPGVNDPFTAIQCIDQLSAALCCLAEREFPSPYRYDDDNKLRVIADATTFVHLTDAAFNQIRQYSKPDVAVVIRLLEAIAIIATHTQNKNHRDVLLRHAETIKRSSDREISEEYDRFCIQERYLAVVKALNNPYSLT
ncbi:DUF2254 domain-containing protein [Aerosakkonema funiforme]|uniref:DUF2254 domain-containing protein n=1 Tax=Aerosakkonema funiforme FACHB-1375 TaxID=2949571 RepID=A0A926VLT6_9CYAN|nr:DUF2254 domain-containing protein [Aerosakkonema funiforme]MBD2185628.1 DUF2254 domain-containing protein [Aerosakkonema funiforme FACHB-1375]